MFSGKGRGGDVSKFQLTKLSPFKYVSIKAMKHGFSIHVYRWQQIFRVREPKLCLIVNMKK